MNDVPPKDMFKFQPQAPVNGILFGSRCNQAKMRLFCTRVDLMTDVFTGRGNVECRHIERRMPQTEKAM